MAGKKKSGFKYELGQTVQMKFSDEEGEVIGRAEYKNGLNQYSVVYRSGNGSQTTTWWDEDLITAKKNTVAKGK